MTGVTRVTRSERELQGVKGGYKGLQKVTEDYWGLQELHRVTRGYKG